MVTILLRQVEVRNRLVDVRVKDGVIDAVAPRLPDRLIDEVVEGDGAALLPGLHDHHLHLLSMAAHRNSVDCGPNAVEGFEGLADALRRQPSGGWIRGTNYHESVAGLLDRHRLDAMVSDRPVRIQHRSGALWMLNSKALELVGDEVPDNPDAERNAQGELTGRLWRLDDVLRRALPQEPPDLQPIDDLLASYGITGVTDASPHLGIGGDWLAAAQRHGRLRVRLHLLAADAGKFAGPKITAGPEKIHLTDHELPALDDIIERIKSARRQQRAVAVHVVTRESLILTLAAFEVTGTIRGDRLEHAAVVPPPLRESIAGLGLTVVTQPGFLRARGDDYLRDVDADDQPWLYPHASLTEAGVRVCVSSDAPHGSPDPWQNIVDATQRRSETGRVLGRHERVSSRQALDGYLSPASNPGGPPRRVRPGEPSDLCLLWVPLIEALQKPTSEHVRRTFYASG